MNDLFGLSMTYVMIALLCVLAVALGTVGWVLLRNRVMFVIGVRNIPRRRAQTTLIIIGLMLSTTIIATAFSIGDTAEYSITTQAYNRLHSVDEIFQAQTGDDNSDPFEGGTSPISAATIPQAPADEFVRQFRDLDGVDGAINVVRWPVSVQNNAEDLAEPIVIMMGLDGAQLEGFESDLETLDGQRVSPDDLAADQIFVNDSLADEINAKVGDSLTLFSLGQPHEFTVRAILEDRVLTGALIGSVGGIVVPLERAQELSGRPGEIDMIAVSNDGGVREGLKLSDRVVSDLNRTAIGSRFIANDTKREVIDDAAATSSGIVTFFVALGLFSIAAGMMLIFLIFVMLAAERKVEMGMMRAVGTKRNHLVQSFMSEGMVYNVGAAAVGCALGVVVSIVMVGFMARLFSSFDLSITFHVTPRSLIVSYAIGVVLTFVTVTFSASRIGALNIVSAIRDLPDPPPVHQRPPMRRVLALVRWLIFKPQRLRDWGIGAGLVVLAAVQVVVVIALFIAAGAVYDESVLRGVLGVLFGILGGFAAAAAALTAALGLNRIFQTGAFGITLGVPLIAIGFLTDQMAPYAGGSSLLLLGSAVTLVMAGLHPRAVFTTTGLTLLVYWLLTAGEVIPPDLSSDIEMFFLSGVTMVLAGTFVLVYNADIILGVVTFAGGAFSTLVPSIRTAVAYPLANKFRTGMTIAMISLVMFALVMMSTINGNFRSIFSSDEALGGYDVLAQENPGNPIDDLSEALREGGGDEAVVGIADIDRVKLANRTTAEVAQIDNLAGDGGDPPDFGSYPVAGLSDGFLRNIDLEFQNRAVGFDSDRAVWDALLGNPDYAVIDAFSLESGGFGDGGGFLLEGVKPTDKQIEPVMVSVRDNASGKRRTVSIIGVIATAGSGIYNGLLLTEEAFDATFARPESSYYFLRVEQSADPDDVAKRVESTLLDQGVQADSLRKIVRDFQAQIEGFLYLIQGFMAIGLLVGIAAVGVIAFRTVIERRQQIGMLRAIGYSRRAVAISFLVESAFVTLLGIISGITLGLLLAFMLLNSNEFVPGGVDSFYIPWVQIFVIAGFAFVASLLMTIIPSRQASSIPIAEALRYE